MVMGMGMGMEMGMAMANVRWSVRAWTGGTQT